MMQVHGAFLKRKSFTKVQPVLPKREKSQKSRQESKRNHRTEHKSMNRPEIELTSYIRKNLIALEEFKTNRTKGSTHFSEQSEGSTEKTLLQSSLPYSYSKVSSHSHPEEHLGLINREQLTSRFTINLNEGQSSSLSNLLHEGKSKNSNPLINTARLIDHQNNNAFETLQIKNNGINNGNRQKNKNQDGFSSNSNNPDYLLPQLVQQDLYNLISNSQNKIHSKQSNDFQQKLSQQEGENFDDYEFGGIQSSNQLQSSHPKNLKTKHINFSPKTKPYEQNHLINQKPQNQRDLNRYIPKSESQHRMGLQLVKNQKASLQGKRQTKQINGFLQEYQKNKNSIHIQSQRKIESNNIIQNFYRERRINSQKNNSSSLPHLKVHSQPKHVVLVPLEERNNFQMKNNKVDQSDSMNTILHKIQQKSKVKSTLSYTKLGFGSSNPRNLNNEDLDENQLQNVKNIQKKLRQKGIQFNSDTLRKALLDFRDGPIHKLSKTQSFGASASYPNSLNKFEVPEKQLFSNAFYKFFPL